jgi:hypothetical protein
MRQYTKWLLNLTHYHGSHIWAFWLLGSRIGFSSDHILSKIAKIPEVRYDDTLLKQVALAGESDQE